MSRSKVILALSAIVAITLVAWYGPRVHRGAQADSLPALLDLAPADSTVIVYADLAALRATPLIERLLATGAPVSLDRDYADFVRGTGFSFERDLDRVVLATRPGPVAQTVAFGEGRFDRQKIGQYALRTGKMENHNGHTVYILPSSQPGKNVSIAFLQGNRIALSSGGDPYTILTAGDSGSQAAFEPAMRERLSRVAGAPFFAVAKAPEAVAGGTAAAGAAASLATPFQALRWLSVAAQPDGGQIVISAEGECDNADQAKKVAGTLEFLRTLLGGALSDPKSRGQMPPESAAQASRLLQAMKISSDGGRVRLLLSVTSDMIGSAASKGTTPPAPTKLVAPSH